MDSKKQEGPKNTTQAGMDNIRRSLVNKKDSALFDVGQVIASRYKVVKVLGHGGFGIVYECEDAQQYGRHIALKTLKHNIPDYARAAKRFEREIALSQALESEHTVKVYDAGVTENDTLYFAMELLCGETLEAFVNRHERFSFLETKNLMLQVLESLKDAHSKGVVHRDMKPSNISLEPLEVSDTYGSGHAFNVRVLDFGIAKIIDTESGQEHAEKLTKTGAWIGSPGYMSPELLKGGEVTPSADIYAVGIIMYEMLVAHQAIYGSSAIEIAVQQMSTEPFPMDDWVLASSFGPIISRCLEKECAKRYQNAADLYEAIELLDDDLLKKEYTAAKLQSFATTRKASPVQQTSQSSLQMASLQTASMTSTSGMVSEEDLRQKQLQHGLIFGIALCVTLIITVVIVKLYIDKRIVLPGIVSETKVLAPYQKDILQSASLGALMGALDPMRVRITVVASPADAKIYRASDDTEIGTSGSVFELIRSLSQWKIILRADGYEDYVLPVTPARFETLTVTLNRKLPAFPPANRLSDKAEKLPSTDSVKENAVAQGENRVQSPASDASKNDEKPVSGSTSKSSASSKTSGSSKTSSSSKKTSSSKSSGSAKPKGQKNMYSVD